MMSKQWSECAVCGLPHGDWPRAEARRYCSEECSVFAGPMGEHWEKGEPRCLAESGIVLRVPPTARGDLEPMELRGHGACSAVIAGRVGRITVIAAHCQPAADHYEEWLVRLNKRKGWHGKTFRKVIRKKKPLGAASFVIRDLEAKQADAAKEQLTYAISDGDGFVKIGRAKCPTSRMRDLQTANARELHLMAVGGDGLLEDEAHRALGKYRAMGEWFSDCDDVRDWIAENLEDVR